MRSTWAGVGILLPLLAAAPTSAQSPVFQGPDFQVNSSTGLHLYPSVAGNAQGDFVMVWPAGGPPLPVVVRGRRFSSSGAPLGSDFLVNTVTAQQIQRASVSEAGDGGFVAVWGSLYGSPGNDLADFSVQARRFDSNGVPQGGQFQVNTYTTSTQEAPSVAVGAKGDFVVVWDSYGSTGTDTSGDSIQARRYASDGSAEGSEFQVNTYTHVNQASPSVALDSRGDFVVVWWSNGSAGSDTSGSSIQGQRFASNGTPLGSEFQVNTSTAGNQINPAVAMRPDGDFVVVWGPTPFKGQRFSSSGSPIGSEFSVNTHPAPSGSLSAKVAVSSGGDFVVTWSSYCAVGTHGCAIGRSFDSNGAPLGDEFQINTDTTATVFVPSVGVGGSENWLVGWGVVDEVAIGARRFDAIVLGSQFQVNSYTTSSQFDPAVASGPSGDFVVVWHSYGSSGTDTDHDGTSIHGQRYASDGSAAGGEFQVNTYTTGYQMHPAVATDFGGRFVVVWQGSQGIEGQRFASNGATQGSEFQVNAPTTGFQQQPAVATDPDGDFVVAWTSAGSSGTDHSGYSIQVQRYASNGSAHGSQFQVNTYTTGTQQNPSVAMDEVGDFLVVWQSEAEGSLADRWGIRARGFASDGTPLDSQEFQVNSYTTNFQDYPSAASDFAGHFVVVWQSDGSDGTDTSYKSIQGQRYASDGSSLGGQFQVNSYTTDFQYRPAVARSGLGGQFVVTWHSRGSFDTDTDSTSIEAQRYASDGTPIGVEFQLNSYTTGFQRNAAVAVDASGGRFVVAWESRGSPGSDSSLYSIQGQRFVPEPDATLALGAGIAVLLGMQKHGARVRRSRRWARNST